MFPLLGHNQWTTCSDYLVGNEPKAMPLDTPLFNDLDEGMQRHIIHTCRIETKDPKKFSLSTPDRSPHALHRVWQGSPSSEWICQDASKLTDSMPSVVTHCGCVAPGLGNSGHRRISTDKSNWGEKRIKSKEARKAQWIHDDAAGWLVNQRGCVEGWETGR